jgi:hypothetical protein
MNKRLFIIAGLACCIALVGCKKKDDLASKDMTGYTFTMRDMTVKFDSKKSNNDYNVTVSTLYGSTDKNKVSDPSATFTWNSSTEASFKLSFEIGDTATHHYQKDQLNLILMFVSKTMGGAFGNDNYVRKSNWKTPEYDPAKDYSEGTSTYIDEGFSLAK